MLAFIFYRRYWTCVEGTQQLLIWSRVSKISQYTTVIINRNNSTISSIVVSKIFSIRTNLPLRPLYWNDTKMPVCGVIDRQWIRSNRSYSVLRQLSPPQPVRRYTATKVVPTERPMENTICHVILSWILRNLSLPSITCSTARLSSATTGPSTSLRYLNDISYTHVDRMLANWTIREQTTLYTKQYAIQYLLCRNYDNGSLRNYAQSSETSCYT